MILLNLHTYYAQTRLLHIDSHLFVMRFVDYLYGTYCVLVVCGLSYSCEIFAIGSLTAWPCYLYRLDFTDLLHVLTYYQ